jgi:hypothetical protein
VRARASSNSLDWNYTIEAPTQKDRPPPPLRRRVGLTYKHVHILMRTTILVIDLAKNDCVGKGQQQFNRPTTKRSKVQSNDYCRCFMFGRPQIYISARDQVLQGNAKIGPGIKRGPLRSTSCPTQYSLIILSFSANIIMQVIDIVVK